MSRDGGGPGDRFRERAEPNRWKLWFLMNADRGLVTGLLVVLVFAVLAGAGILSPGAESAVRTSDSVGTLFQALVAATLTGVTLVLTLNQLVLSQELGAAGDQRDRMEGAMGFRAEVADVVDAPVSPSRPAQFLRALVEVSAQRARDLQEAVAEADEAQLREDVDHLVGSLVENAQEVSRGLDDARFGEFDVISSALDFNYSWKIFAARRIRAQHGDRLGEEAAAALDELVEVLTLFGPAREHFKTLYFQRELIDLSRHILAAGIPALLVSGYMVLYFNDALAYGTLAGGVAVLVPLLAAATTAALVPFLVLLAYVLRIATVTKHTLSIGPFILRETDEAAEVTWNR
jgi:hypothetical protein